MIPLFSYLFIRGAGCGLTGLAFQIDIGIRKLVPSEKDRTPLQAGYADIRFNSSRLDWMRCFQVGALLFPVAGVYR